MLSIGRLVRHAKAPRLPDPGAGLLTAFDYVWGRLESRLEGLGDREYLWEPVAGCWTIRPEAGSVDGSATWYLDGKGPDDDPPDPAPFTTIAWRMGHLGVSGLGGFTDVVFDRKAPPQPPLAVPANADGARAMMTANYDCWRSGLAAVGAVGWWRRLGPDFGDYADSTKLDLAIHVFDELVHHGAEIALLRDLYRATGASKI